MASVIRGKFQHALYVISDLMGNCKLQLKCVEKKTEDIVSTNLSMKRPTKCVTFSGGSNILHTGGANPRPIIRQNFAENCIKMKEIGLREEGSSTPPLHPPLSLDMS